MREERRSSELTALARDAKSDDDAFYLLTFIRERTDGVGGMFGRMLKGKAEEAAAENVRRYLNASQPAIETYYRDSLARRNECASPNHCLRMAAKITAQSLSQFNHCDSDARRRPYGGDAMEARHLGSFATPGTFTQRGSDFSFARSTSVMFPILSLHGSDSSASIRARKNCVSAASDGRMVFFVRMSVALLAIGMDTPSISSVS